MNFQDFLERNLIENLEKIYKEEFESVMAFGLRYCPSSFREPEVVRDLVHETFLKCSEKISMYDPSKSSLRTWFFTCLKNRIITYFKAKINNHKRIEYEGEWLSSFEDTGLRVSSKIISSEIKKCLIGLKRVDREIISYHYFDAPDLSSIQKCKKFKISHDAYRQKLQRAKNKFKKMWISNHLVANEKFMEVVGEGKHLYDV